MSEEYRTVHRTPVQFDDLDGGRVTITIIGLAKVLGRTAKAAPPGEYRDLMEESARRLSAIAKCGCAEKMVRASNHYWAWQESIDNDGILQRAKDSGAAVAVPLVVPEPWLAKGRMLRSQGRAAG